MPGVPFFGKGTIIINIGILETPSLVPLHLLNIHLPVRYFSYIKIFLFLTVCFSGKYSSFESGWTREDKPPWRCFSKYIKPG